tara:strand:- start:406 stop:2634 length:2229 start_codon:yes stop_codon:yes gene_type:complete
LRFRINIKIIQSLIFFIICLSLSIAQTYNISGRILDSDTKEPIQNVSIFISNSDLATITDKEGYFLLFLNNQLENRVVLNIKIMGYKEILMPLELSASMINLGEIHMISQSLELESVHVHSHKEESKQISDFSLSGQKLNDNLRGNIAATLSNQPNIGVSSFGTVTSKPVLRGYSGDRFLLTKDGNEAGDLSQSSIDHAIALDMNEVNAIEIIRGPKALIFGANAIGGVVNTSISGNPKMRVSKIYKKIIFGGESFNRGLYGSLMLHIPIKEHQLNLSFNNRNTKDQSSPIGNLENTYSTSTNHKLGFTRYSKSGYINFILENHNMDYGIPPNSDDIRGVDIKLEKNTFQSNYHKDITFYNFNQFDAKYNLIDYGHKEFESNNSLGVALNKRTNNIKIELQSLNTIIGAELDYKQFSSGGLYFTPNTNELNFSIYAFNEIDLKNLTLLSSLRLSHLSIKPNQYNYNNIDSEQVRNRRFDYFSSSLGIKKSINKFEINSWFMNTMRAPRVEELYSDGPHLATYSYEIGEPNLELEKIYGIESSIAYNASSLTISLTNFYNYSPYYHQMKQMGECLNESDPDSQSHPCANAEFIEWSTGLYKYKIKGIKSLIRGLEFNLGYDYKNFKITYDFSLTRGDDLTNKSPLSYINPDKQILILEYQKELMNYKLRLSRIHSQNRLGEFETYTSSASLVDFIVSYQKNNQNITMQINNILDEKYYNHLSKIKSIMPEAGRNIVINYKILF